MFILITWRLLLRSEHIIPLFALIRLPKFPYSSFPVLNPNRTFALFTLAAQSGHQINPNRTIALVTPAAQSGHNTPLLDTALNNIFLHSLTSDLGRLVRGGGGGLPNLLTSRDEGGV